MVIYAFLFHERSVITSLVYPALIQYYDLICSSYRIETMGDDKDRLIDTEFIHRFPYISLIIGIYTCNSFIKDNDGSILEDTAGYGYTLSLAS